MGMSTKQYLSQIERLDRMIQNNLSEINKLRNMAVAITNTPKEVDVQTTPEQDRLGNAVAKIVDLEDDTDKLVDEYIDKKQHIISQIEGMEDTNMYHVLFNVYVSRKSLYDIADEMKYSDKQTKRIYHKALKEFEKLYGAEYLKSCPQMSPNVPKCPVEIEKLDMI